MLEQLRRGFRTAAELTQVLSLPSVGILPQLERAHAKTAAAARVALEHPASFYGKSLAGIRGRLMRTRKRQRGELLTVLSALPNEGKSTFACNLALTSSRSGLSTLLIDGDVYTASATKAFGLRKPGLFEIVQGKSSFSNAVARDADSGLHVLGARDLSKVVDVTRDFDPAGLIPVLREFSKHFDLVIVDSPAILPLGGSGAYLQCADRAVLLVEWDRTDRAAVADALETLDFDARKIVGVVLNKVPIGWCHLFSYGAYQKVAAYAKAAA